MLFVCYPKCTTCKKALKFLQENNINVEVRDIALNNPTANELKEWISLSNKDIDKFFNTSGLKYKELGLSSKKKTMSYDEKIALLSTDGMLVKRPILVLDNQVLVGFKEEEYKGALCKI